MKKLLNGIILVILVPSLVMAWEGEIVFEDNFTGDELDRDKWEYQEGCGNSNLHHKRIILFSLEIWLILVFFSIW